jgi:hypothetical protein
MHSDLAADSRAAPLALRSSASRLRHGGRAFVWVRTALACAAAVAALTLLAREGTRVPAEPAPVRTAVLVAPAPAWAAIPQAKPHYALDAPELRPLPRTFEARRRADGGREDKLAHGTFESETAYLRLAVFRGPAEPEPGRSFFIDLARRAGEAGLGVLRTGRPESVATKLGAIETAEAVLADGLERPCRAFRLRHEAGLSLHGWHCAAGGSAAGEAPGPAEIACLVDRLALLPAAEDPGLKALFGQAEKRRSEGCPARAGEGKRGSS